MRRAIAPRLERRPVAHALRPVDVAAPPRQRVPGHPTQVLWRGYGYSGGATPAALEPQLTCTGSPLATRRQSTVANVDGSIVPCAVTQSMSSWRISTCRL